MVPVTEFVGCPKSNRVLCSGSILPAPNPCVIPVIVHFPNYNHSINNRAAEQRGMLVTIGMDFMLV